MKFMLKINCDNAAFEDDVRRNEVARILEEIATSLVAFHTDHGTTRDLNGNVVGN